ncbi:MAG TPA: iron ABC transporter permease [Gaiellaceae bacterium]|nr:iron ABC transporter permease [Gaiellaceae bacterium]
MSGRPPLALTVVAVATVALVLLPLAYLVLRAATGGADAWEVLGRRGTLRLVVDTALLVVAVVGAAVAVAVPLAWLVTRTDLPGARAWAVAGALPLVIPSYVAALALLGAFGPRGLLQDVLGRAFGVERLPEIYGFPGAFLALTLSTYPYVFLLVAAALRSLDPSLEEASRGLGRTPWQTFAHVTLPALRPAIGAGSLLVALYVLADFGAVSLMQYDALTRAVYLQYRALFDRDPAAVLALVLVALTAVVLLLESRSRRGAGFHRATPGTARPPARVELGRWRWPALAFCALAVGLFLVVPLAVLVYWTARGEHGVELPWAAAARSVGVAALAAGVAAAAVLPLAVLAGRWRRPWTAALERAAYASNALPGIVIALALVFFGARYGGFLYQTLVLLVFAYVVRFFPQGLAGATSALRSVSPRVEEAARGLGRGPSAVFARVTLPLMRPGVLAGAALVFLSTMKELPATLLLRPIGFETLATEIWKYTSLASYSRAAPPALLLIVVSAPLVWALTARRGSELGPPG